MAEAPWRQAAVPPPPPPGATGHIPASKLKSEVSERRAEPPLCVQNAMLTKDKKPFTYTPGGIDLSEIRSPRMARRLERNAMNEGVSPIPQTQHHPSGPLPPSALAAMQPQLPVQVFPSGGVPQLPHTGPPAPPPPPPKAPPMKTSPVPTDCYDRPDMTKIIPDNPMSLLRKTTGPIVKQDPILNKSNYTNRAGQDIPFENVHTHQPSSETNYPPAPKQTVPQPKRQISMEPPPLKPTSGVGSIYVPPINNKPQYTEPSPPVSQISPLYYKRQPSIGQPESPKPQTPDTLNSPKPSLSKAPTPWLTQRRQQSQDLPEWAVNDHRVQSPPIQQEPQQQPWLPPEKQEPPPQTKPVRPWQQQQTETQSWQQRLPEQRNQPPIQYHSNLQQRQQPQQFRPEPQTQSPVVQKQGGVRKQIENRENPQEYNPVEKTEIVIVNDPPLVFQHPGQAQQRVTRQVPYQQQHQESGTRIIPVQVEGRASNGQIRSPPHNRVLQKITQTDGDDDDSQIAIEHSPKMYHQFPERQSSVPQHQQQRKWSHGSNDQALMNSFKEVPQEQHQPGASGAKVRTIPIQIEGNGSIKNYVPPSEQTVQEPKKYMGSSIPSRSFKILQAMTAPDECGPGQSDL